MTLRRGLALAMGLLPLAAGTAFAQFPPAPGQEPPCLADFTKLRNDAENKAKMIQVSDLDDHDAVPPDSEPTRITV